MAGARGYHTYRGRTPKGKIALAVVLVLVILASAVFILIQQFVVYDAVRPSRRKRSRMRRRMWSSPSTRPPLPA
mgnify:CR=1 FL=1